MKVFQRIRDFFALRETEKVNLDRRAFLQGMAVTSAGVLVPAATVFDFGRVVRPQSKVSLALDAKLIPVGSVYMGTNGCVYVMWRDGWYSITGKHCDGVRVQSLRASPRIINAWPTPGGVRVPRDGEVELHDRMVPVRAGDELAVCDMLHSTEVLINKVPVGRLPSVADHEVG